MTEKPKPTSLGHLLSEGVRVTAWHEGRDRTSISQLWQRSFRISLAARAKAVAEGID